MAENMTPDNMASMGLAFGAGVITTYIYVKVGLSDMIVVGGILFLAYNAQNVAILYKKYKDRNIRNKNIIRNEDAKNDGIYNMLVENLYNLKSITY
jgi:hypothetical protein